MFVSWDRQSRGVSVRILVVLCAAFCWSPSTWWDSQPWPWMVSEDIFLAAVFPEQALLAFSPGYERASAAVLGLTRPRVSQENIVDNYNTASFLSWNVGIRPRSRRYPRNYIAPSFLTQPIFPPSIPPFLLSFLLCVTYFLTCPSLPECVCPCLSLPGTAGDVVTAPVISHVFLCHFPLVFSSL